MIKIYTDSTCDLTKELLNKYDISILPLYVTFDNDVYKDGIEITSSQLYKKVDELKKLPKTSAASVGDYMEIFSKELEQGNDVVFIAISSGFSSTYNNGLIAIDTLETDRVVMVDSKNLSSGNGLVVLKAAKLRDEGKNIHQIKEELDNKIIPNVRSKFVVDSLEYLHKGGRCSGASRLFGTLLQLKPVIEVKDGKMEVAAKTRGKTKGLNFMLEDIISNKEKVDLEHIMITHTYADEDEKYLREKLAQEFPNANIDTTTAGCVISSHCGKGTIGILYIINE